MGKNGLGEEAEFLFADWHNRINSHKEFADFGTKLIDVRNETAYQNTTDIDYIVTGATASQQDGKPIFHEIKQFKDALQNGNFYIEQIKNSKHILGEIIQEKRPKKGTAVEFMPDKLSYQTGLGWLYKNTSFHADFFHAYLPYNGASERCNKIDKHDFLNMIQNTGKTAKLIVEAPTGIWISMEYAAMTNLNHIVKDDARLYPANLYNDKTFILLNFSSSLVMLADTPFQYLSQPPITIDWGGKSMGQGYPTPHTYTMQFRPVVKCVSPDQPDEEITEIMETAITDYYIPKRLYQKCQSPSSENFNLYSSKYGSQHDRQKLAGNMLAALIEKLQCAKVF